MTGAHVLACRDLLTGGHLEPVPDDGPAVAWPYPDEPDPFRNEH